ncbi:MAG TPA: hypothetical protein VHB25_11990 [Gemmatimonadaceae bacterium]|nr:hypothetical protein [Gemmatimonadaceae bacterium]
MIRHLAYSAYARARRTGALIDLETLESVARRAPATVRRDALGALLAHCREHVPYYADLLSRLPAATARHPEAALRALPFLTKDIIRTKKARLWSDDLARRRWRYNTSGGSTGEPVRHVQDQAYADRTAATALWAHRRMGYEFGELVYKLWGDEREVLLTESAAKRRARAWLYNTHVLNAFRLSPADMEAYARLMTRRPARFVQAYAQSAYDLASYAERAGLRIAPQGFVTTSAGTLYDFMRETISRVFQCPVYNYYGSREAGLIATELPGAPGLWVPPWAQYIEVIDAQGAPCPPGVEGELVVTCLANAAMPLLRYRIGDRGALLPDDGGVQRLASVSGRVVDIFRCADGGAVDGEFFTHLLYGRPWVQKFQFIQRSYERIELRVVRSAGENAPEHELADVRRSVRTVMGERCDLDVRFMDEIPPLASGKYRYTICELESAS